MKLLALLESTTIYLGKNGVESPRLTTELLLAHVLQKSRMQLYLEFESNIADAQLDQLRPLVKKRAEGIPLEHILGCKEFDGHRFTITPDVLIPRPETEILMEAIVPLVDPAATDLPLIDVGAGSGILAISLAHRFPKLKVIALDCCEKALAVARENGSILSNIEYHPSDLLAAFSGQAQLIVANLPYIPSSEIPKLSREVRREPAMALDGGADGMDLIRRLISDASGRTHWLALEIGDEQAETVKTLFAESRFEVTHVVPDLKKMERIVIGKANG